jgi:hypothetical protein
MKGLALFLYRQNLIDPSNFYRILQNNILEYKMNVVKGLDTFLYR